jgi:hypothetical protein
MNFGLDFFWEMGIPNSKVLAPPHGPVVVTVRN